MHLVLLVHLVELLLLLLLVVVVVVVELLLLLLVESACMLLVLEIVGERCEAVPCCRGPHCAWHEVVRPPRGRAVGA